MANPANVTFNAVFNAQQALRVIQQLRAGLVGLQRTQQASQRAGVQILGTTTSLIARAVQLTAAWAGIRSIFGAIGEGLKFNRIIETSRLGIAALITAEANLRNEHGRLLTGTEALAAAQGLAQDQLNKLRIAGIRTAATTEELVTAFQEAVGAGVSVGLTLDQIRTFTVQVSQAASTINLPFNQLNQEVRSILQGTIDRNSRIAKALQLTNAQVNLAKQQNRLADLLNEKFQAFSVAGDEVVKTWAALGSNIKDAVQLLGGDITKGFFTQIRDAGQFALSQIFDLDRAEIRESFRGLVGGFKAIFDDLGSALAAGIRAAVGAAQNLSVWLDKNKKAVQDTVLAVGTLFREFVGLVADIIGVATGMGKAAVESGKLADTIRTITSFIRFLRDHIDGVVATLEGMVASGLVVAALSNPIAAAVAGVIILIGYLNKLNSANAVARSEFNRTIETFGRNTAEAVRLAEEYINLGKAIDSGKLKGQELKDALAQLDSIQDRLIRSDSRFAAVFQKQGQSYTQIGLAIRAATNDQIAFLNAQVRGLRVQEQATQAQLRSLDATETGDISQFAGEGNADFKKREQQVAALRANLAEIRGAIANANGQLVAVGSAINRAQAELQAVSIEAKEGQRKAQLEKALKEALDAAKARLKTAEQTAKSETAIEKSKFEQNLISATDYYISLRDLQNASLDREEEVAALELRLAQLAQDPGDIAKAKEHQARIEEERKEVIIRANQDIVAASREFVATRRGIDTQLLSFGDRDDQLLGKVREITEQFRVALETAFRNKDFKTVLNISRLIDLKVAREQFEQLKAIVDDAETHLQNRIAEIQINLQAGTINQAEAGRQLAFAYDVAANKTGNVIDSLEKLRPLLKGDPAFIEFLDNLSARFTQLQHNSELARDGLLKVKAGFREAVESGLTQFFENIGDGSKTAATLFREFANSIISDMKRIIAQVIASRIIQTIFGGFGAASAVPGAGNSTQSGGGASGGRAGSLAPRRATGGGFVVGPGTPTSDSIPLVWVSKDEYVQPAHAVRRYGLGFQEAVRQGRIPKEWVRQVMAGIGGMSMSVVPRSRFNSFAAGGSLSRAVTARQNLAQRQEAHLTINDTLTVDHEGLLRVFRGKVGRNLTMGHIGSNPRLTEKLTSHSLKR